MLNNILQIPNDCIINKPIFKTLLNENANLNTRNKKILTDYIQKIKWYGRFAEDNTRIKPYIDNKKEYLEVEIITIQLKEENLIKENIDNEIIIKPEQKINRIIDIIFRFIPYPQLIIIKYKNFIKLNVANIRNHDVDPTKITIDETIKTPWINTENLEEIDKTFFENIQYANHNMTNMHSFYKTYIDSITHYNASKRVDKNVKLEYADIKIIEDEINILEKEIKKLRQKLKKETQASKEVKLNNQIREKRIKLKKLEKQLKGD